MKFEWDKTKAERNEQKHGIRFQEAISVFDDPLSELFDDLEHSDQETRLILIGHSDSGRLLVVSFTERSDVTRIISARSATRGEQKEYGE
ncbi:MAG: BrnT family toxin [Janthinobacterium lividum]